MKHQISGTEYIASGEHWTKLGRCCAIAWVALFILLSPYPVQASCSAPPTYALSGFSYPVGDRTRWKPDGWGMSQTFTASFDYQGDCGMTAHPGIDFNKTGTADHHQVVFAAANGVVERVVRTWHCENSNDPHQENYFNILIRHVAPPQQPFILPDGSTRSVVWTLYGHLEDSRPPGGMADSSHPILVNEGDVVNQGDPLGSVGLYSCGSVPGSHLHFEVRTAEASVTHFPCGSSADQVKQRYVDPDEFIPLNRGFSAVAGLHVANDRWELHLAEQVDLSMLVRNQSRSWITIADMTVAVERCDFVDKSVCRRRPDTFHLVGDLEGSLDTRLLAPPDSWTGVRFPGTTEVRYHKENLSTSNLNLALGVWYRAKAKALVSVFEPNYDTCPSTTCSSNPVACPEWRWRSFWVDIPFGLAEPLPSGLASARSEWYFRVTDTLQTTTTILQVDDLTVNQSTVKSGTYEVAWTAPGTIHVGTEVIEEPADSYDLRYSDQPITTVNFLSATTLTAPTPSSPGANEEVSFQAPVTGEIYVAVAVDGDSDRMSNVGFFDAEPCEPPPPVSGESLSEVTPTTVKVGWTNQGGNVFGYEILDRVGDSTEFQSVGVTTAGGTWFRHTGLEPDSRQDYIVLAWNDCGPSTFDSVHGVTTAEQPPEPIDPDTPDLTLVLLEAPSIVEKGGGFGFWVRIRMVNQGTGDAENFGIRPYMSSILVDLWLQPSALEPTEHFDLAAGQELEYELFVGDPSQTVLDTPYYLGVAVDYDDDVVEELENNNTLTTHVTFVDEISPPTGFDCLAKQEEATIICSWDAGQGFDTYSLYRYDVSSETGSFVYDNGPDTTVSVPSQPGTYRFQVSGYIYDAMSYSEYSSPVEIDLSDREDDRTTVLSYSGEGTVFVPIAEWYVADNTQRVTRWVATTATADLAVVANLADGLVVQTTNWLYACEQNFNLGEAQLLDFVLLDDFLGEPALALIERDGGWGQIQLLRWAGSAWSDPITVFRENHFTFNVDRVRAWLSGDFDGSGTSQLAAFYRYPDRAALFVFSATGPEELTFAKWVDGLDLGDPSPGAITAGGFGGDDLDDIVITRTLDGIDEALVFESLGNAFAQPVMWLQQPSEGSDFGRFHHLLALDIDGDGFEDLAGVQSGTDSGALVCLRSTGTGFAESESCGAVTSGVAVTAADVGNDGFSELLAFPFSSSSLFFTDGFEDGNALRWSEIVP